MNLQLESGTSVKKQVKSVSIDDTLLVGAVPSIVTDALASEDLKVSPSVRESAFPFKSHDFFKLQIDSIRAKLRKYPNDAILLNSLGNAYLAQGKIPKANKLFQESFRIDENYLEAGRNLARTHILCGKLIEAQKIFQHIVDKISDEPSLIHELALIEIILEEHKSAINRLQSISTQYVNYHEVLNTLGLIHLLSKKYKDAKVFFEKSIKYKTDYVYAINNLGVAYKGLGDLGKAADYFNKALSIDENYIDPYVNIFWLKASDRDFKGALSTIVKAQKFKKIDHELIFKYAWTLMNLKKYDEAIEKYKEVLEILPDNMPTLNNIGFCYVQKGDFERGLAYYRQALRGSRKPKLPLRNLLLTLADLRQYDEAVKLAQSVLRRNPDYVPALNAMAAKFIADEDWDTAERYLDKAYEKRPKLISIYVSLGFILEDIRHDYERAAEVLRVPIDEGVTDPILINNLVHLYLISDKIEEAMEYVDKLDLGSPVSKATMGLLRLKENKLEEAERIYQEAIEAAPLEFKPKIEQRWFFDRANFFLSRGDREKAINDLKQAIKIQKGFRYVSEQAARLLGELNRDAT